VGYSGAAKWLGIDRYRDTAGCHGYGEDTSGIQAGGIVKNTLLERAPPPSLVLLFVVVVEFGV